MGIKNEYLELLEKVARVNTIQQQLINARDELDKELETYKRIANFYTKAISLTNTSSVLKFAADAIIDIFELEGGIVSLGTTNSGDAELQFEGNTTYEEARQVIDVMKEVCTTDHHNRSNLLDRIHIPDGGNFNNFNQGIVYRTVEQKYGYDLILFGYISKENFKLYKTLNSRDLAVFNILAQNTIMLLNGVIDKNKLSEQLEKIKASKRELKRLSLIATNTRSGVSITDRSGYTKWVNRAFEETTGYTLSEALGRKPGTMLQGALTDGATTREIGRCIREGKGIITDIINYTKSGNMLYIELEIVPTYDEEGNLDGFVALQHDKTKQQEQFNEINEARSSLMAANDELKKTNAELDLIVYRLSHDLRSPLTSIKGLLDLISSNESPENNSEFLNLIEVSVNRLDDTIEGILSVSRNARMTIETEDVALRPLISDIIDQVRHIHTHDIDTTITLKNVEVLHTDRERFKTVMINLIANAFKYCRKDTKSFVKVTVENIDEQILIEVEDNGEGIAPEFQEKIFGMFYRATTSDTGSGLGLYICKEIISKMNGTIGVKSAKGIGTTFTVTFPLIKVQ